MPTAALPYDPSYSYKLKRTRRILLAAMEDGSVSGRIKSPAKWAFELVFNERELSEFVAFVAFADAQGYSTPFTYNDPVLGTTMTARFDSEVEGSPTSFNDISYSVRVVEWT